MPKTQIMVVNSINATNNILEKEIVLNSMYSGSYLDENIGHEAINLFKTDCGECLIYLQPHGTFAKEHIGLVDYMLLVRKVDGFPLQQIVGKVEILKEIYNPKLSLKDQKLEQKPFLKKEYGGVTLEKIFQDSAQQDIFVTYIAKSVYLPSDDIFLQFHDSNNKLGAEKASKYFSNIIHIDANLAKQSQKQYFNNIKDEKNYNILEGIINDSKIWTTEICSLSNQGINNVNTICDFFEISGMQDYENAYSNALAHFIKKYPELLSRFIKFSKNPKIKKRIKEINTTKLIVKREYRNIDILITDGNVSFVIENKITSGINGIDRHDKTKNQLTKYYNYFRSKNKDDIEFQKKFPNPIFILLHPEYNNIDLAEYNANKIYLPMKYTEISSFIDEIISETPYCNDIHLLDFAHSLKRHTEKIHNDAYKELMKKLHLSINKIKRTNEI